MVSAPGRHPPVSQQVLTAARWRVRSMFAALVLALNALAVTGTSGLANSDTSREAERMILSTFEQINRMPRCSKDEARIAAWLEEWARSRNLAVTSDTHRNVLITVPASPGWERRAGVILQAHMDMVCLKTEGSTHDFARDPIPLMHDGEWIHAKDTSLGADNGIGIAIALTVADRLTGPHPKLELLFTTDEEKDMTGVAGLSPTALTGSRLINLDSEDASVVTLGAAGGISTEITLPIAKAAISADMQVFTLKVAGLLGGHSGVDIDKNRANASVLAAEALADSVPFQLISMTGGKAGNAIATSAEVVLAVNPADAASLEERLANFTSAVRLRYPDEKDVSITLSRTTNALQPGASEQASATSMALITSIPQGVTAWSKEFKGLPETSNNIGIVSSGEDALSILTFQRSFHADHLREIASRIAATAREFGASSSQKGEFPAWPPNSDTKLYKAVIDAYARLFGAAMRTDVVHAGLECGYIAKMYPSIEIVSIGATLENVHSTRERLKVDSLQRTWALLQDVLRAE